jgi:hypothetical protein
VFWVLGAPEPVSKTAGAAVFLGAGVTAGIPGFWLRNWYWGLAIIGVVLGFMTPRAVLLGALLVLPFIVIVVGRAWAMFKDWIVKNSREAKRA